LTPDSSGDGAAARAAALHDEFEELLNQVLASEREWSLLDRIDLDCRRRALQGEQDGDGPA
jgi:hypothetical protein